MAGGGTKVLGKNLPLIFGDPPYRIGIETRDPLKFGDPPPQKGDEIW